jgi:hypothetical protein
MPNTPEHLAGRLIESGEKSLAFFRQLVPEEWIKPVYTEGARWTPRQVLAHFVSAEAGRAQLIQNILAGGAGSPEDFAIDLFNEGEVTRLSNLATEMLLLQFTELRQVTANLVRSISPSDLAKTGRDPFLGLATLEEIIQLTYRHNQIHLREMRRALG